MNSTTSTSQPTDTTAGARVANSPALRPCAPATGGLNPRPLARSRTHSGSAVEVNLCTPIAVDVQGWCGDAVAVDSRAAPATAVAQAVRTYRAVIIDLTRVRALSAAGSHCLDCIGQAQDEQQGFVHLVCAEPSAVRGMLQQMQLRHRWPVHPDLADAVGQVMQPAADPPEPTGALPRTTPSGIGSRSVVRPDSLLASPAQTRSPAHCQGQSARPPLAGVIEPTTDRTQHLVLNETRRHEDTTTRRGSWV